MQWLAMYCFYSIRLLGATKNEEDRTKSLHKTKLILTIPWNKYHNDHHVKAAIDSWTRENTE